MNFLVGPTRLLTDHPLHQNIKEGKAIDLLQEYSEDLRLVNCTPLHDFGPHYSRSDCPSTLSMWW